ncbi:hypothetical protein SAMN05421761_10474 [Belliella pelovolcani]|uniref:Uncharacterized protein n=1 Tax=Belliella pelovolcani TaxID=529505 RepID=A0A1N7LSI0_9BACT|nr:hypothetical protein SAMN05421761_10474 [Belliella pelovolcani]
MFLSSPCSGINPSPTSILTAERFSPILLPVIRLQKGITSAGAMISNVETSTIATIPAVTGTAPTVEA